MIKGQNFNHPKKGSVIKVEPIRELKDIQTIKEMIVDNLLHYCLFVVGINTNLRTSDLLSLTVAQVSDLVPMGEVVIKERKTGKERRVVFNKATVDAIRELCAQHVFDSAMKDVPAPVYLFSTTKGTALQVPSVTALVKLWCRKVGLKGNYGAHTLRKTWAYQQFTLYSVSVPVLMKCLNHSSERQVLTYIGVCEATVKEVYENEL
jgi:integrase